MKGKTVLKAILFCIVFTVLLIIFSSAKAFLPGNFERLAHGVVGILAALLTTLLFLKYDRKRFSDIGLRVERNTLFRFFIGVVIGVVIMGILALSVIYFSNLHVEINEGSSLFLFLIATAPLLPLAFMEELGFRAYPLRILEDSLGVRLSILITSVLFALYHIPNGWSIASAFYGPAIWGLVFGLAAIKTRGIAMPTGIHYAINLTTSAFGEKGTSASIWTVTNNAVLVEPKGIDWVVVLPAFALLVFAVLCIEIYLRRKSAN